MANHPVRFGLIAGGITVACMILLYFLSKSTLLQFGSMIEFVIVIYYMTRAVSATRTDGNGYIAFNEAFKASWLTFILASSIAAIFIFLLMNYIDPSLKDMLKQLQLESVEQITSIFRMSEDMKEQMITQIEDSDVNGIKSLAYQLPLSFLFPGVIYALVISLIMKKSAPFTNE